jgi:hypothetical protein
LKLTIYTNHIVRIEKNRKVYILPYRTIQNMTQKIYSWVCEKCSKKVWSLYPEQLEQNKDAHKSYCDKYFGKKDEKKGDKDVDNEK